MKRLAHGPLLFWSITVIVLAVAATVAGIVGRGADDLAPAATHSSSGDVRAVFQALSVLPSLSSEPRDVSAFTASLVETANAHADAGGPAMRAAWSELAAAATELGAVDVASVNEYRAALANLAVAGDRLVAADAGITLLAPPAPRTGVVAAPPASQVPSGQPSPSSPLPPTGD